VVFGKKRRKKQLFVALAAILTIGLGIGVWQFSQSPPEKPFNELRY
jgi:hypothetical protein